MTYPRHSSVNHEISTIDEAALVAGQENNSMSLLNGLAETPGREVDFTTEALGLIIAEPILQKRSATDVSIIHLSSKTKLTSTEQGTKH